MSFVIDNNGFTKDSYGVRSTRLSLLSANIGTFVTELSIPVAVETWAEGSADAWQAKLAENTYEQGEKFEAFQTSQEADAALLERYVLLKELLLSRYGDNNEMLRLYGIDGPVPDTHADVVNKAYDLIKTNDVRIGISDPNALPLTMTDNLKILTDDAYNKYQTAITELAEAKGSTEELRALFDSDAVSLRKLYSWVVAYWGKTDPRLLELGFVQIGSHSGGHVPDPPELAYSTSGLSWNEITDATSYQLVYKAVADVEFQELYSGVYSELPIPFNPGNGVWITKIRARNLNGYGDWSADLQVTIGLQPTTITGATYNTTTHEVTLTWLSSPGADGYDVYRSRVPLNDPPGAFTIVPPMVTALAVIYEATIFNFTEHYFVIVRAGAESSLQSNIMPVNIPNPV